MVKLYKYKYNVELTSMRTFLERLMFRFSMFMQGRYGFDKLSKAMIICALILIVIANIFRGLSVFGIVSWVLIFMAYFRAFSKDIYKRNRELLAYTKATDKLRKKYQLKKRIWNERKKYKYFKCKNCGAYWRVPRGLGVTEITCRICKEKMTKKS